MDPYRKYLHTYISLSGPHLGYLYSSNSLFNSGLWLLKKLKSTQVIHQLTLTDDPDLQNTFFYKLCKVEKDLNIFIKIWYHSLVLMSVLKLFSAKDSRRFQEHNSPVFSSGTLTSAF